MSSDRQPCGDCPLVPKGRKAKAALIQATIKTFAGESNRAIAKRLKVIGTDHKTVAEHRHKLENTGEIPRLTELVRTDGRTQPLKPRAERDGPTVQSCIRGENRHLIAEVVRLYMPPGQRVADVTYGLGRFWRLIDTTQYDFWPSDIATCERKYDFTALPYPDTSFDTVVFDPPYIERGKERTLNEKGGTPKTYGVWLHTQYKVGGERPLTYADVIGLFKGGMAEAFRVLRPGGRLWVKCCDQKVSGHNRWTHLTVHNIARRLGMIADDLFVLHRLAKAVGYGRQRVARKNHSYLWIFQKPKRKEKKDD